MAEKKTKEQIEAEILKEATQDAKKEKKEKAPLPQKERKETKKPTAKEKIAATDKGKGGAVKKALETVKKLKGKKGEEKKERKIKFERIYTVSLRTSVSRSKRTRKSMKTLRDYVQKHAKAKEIKIEQEINHFIYARGHQKPPNKIRISVAVDEEGLATVALKK